MPDIPVEYCCGCSACSSICPQTAIKMISDNEGFFYPEIDKSLCVECNKCEDVCPVINPPELNKEFIDCVVAQSENSDVLNESTSGGFIDSLYRYVLEECNGYAAGVAYNSNFLPIHIITNSYEKAKEFRNSKYAQSDLSGIFNEILELLIKDKYLIFVGTPCQVAGLKAFLQKDYEKLITVDLVCRSIPSPTLWRSYLDWQEKRYKSRIKKVTCRKKTYGYHSGTLEIEFENGRHYSGSNRIDYYMKSFHSDICSRFSCYNCKFKSEHRCSDFTVFDSWNPERVVDSKLTDNDCGYSNVVVHTQKGKDILYNLKNIVLEKADSKKIFNFSGGMESNSIKYNSIRDVFYKDIDNSGFSKGVKKHIKITALDYMIEYLKPIRYSLKKFLRR